MKFFHFHFSYLQNLEYIQVVQDDRGRSLLSSLQKLLVLDLSNISAFLLIHTGKFPLFHPFEKAHKFFDHLMEKHQVLVQYCICI